MTQMAEVDGYRGEQPTSPTLALAYATLHAHSLTPQQLSSIDGPFGIRRYADGSDLRPTDRIIEDSLRVHVMDDGKALPPSAHPTLAAELYALQSGVRGEEPVVMTKLILGDLEWDLA